MQLLAQSLIYLVLSTLLIAAAAKGWDTAFADSAYILKILGAFVGTICPMAFVFLGAIWLRTIQLRREREKATLNYAAAIRNAVRDAANSSR